MNADALVGKLLLWHVTDVDSAEAIVREGFCLSRRPARWMHRDRAIYFFSSPTAFLDRVADLGDRAGSVGFLCAVSPADFILGHDYAHDTPDVFVFHKPLPSRIILCRFGLEGIDGPAALLAGLSEQLGWDVRSALSSLCADASFPWHGLVRIAGMFRALDGPGYREERVTARLLREEVPGLDDGKADRLFEVLDRGPTTFRRRLLDNYYCLYPFPHWCRALTVSGAQFVRPVEVLSYHDPASPALSGGRLGQTICTHNSVEQFLRYALGRATRRDVVYGAIEMAAMRRFPDTREGIEPIEEWLAQQGAFYAETAYHFIRYGFDSFPMRRGETAVSAAVAVLRGTGMDPWPHLQGMTQTDYPVTHLGLIEAAGLLGEQRAIPYLRCCLNDQRKQIRRPAIRALGRIGTPDALERVRRAADDPARSVRRAAEAALSMAQHPNVQP